MARKQLSRKVTWWLGEETQNRLKIWTRMLLLPLRRYYRILLQNEGTGYHNWKSCIIQANCQLFGTEPVKDQFTLTQLILAHEVGHALGTDHATDRGQLLHQVVNILEDQRIENMMMVRHPALDFLLMRKHMWKRTTPVGGAPNVQALDLCLDWRFAHHFVSEETMLKQLRVHPDAVGLWRKIRPLVEQAWTARNTKAVEALARRIIEILDLRETASPLIIGNLRAVTGSDVEDERESSALPFPTEADPDSEIGVLDCAMSDDEPGSGKDRGGDFYEEDAYTQPAPYTELETEAAPITNAIANKLMLPDPQARKCAHLYKGRYNARQAIRTPETPFTYQNNPGVSGRHTCIDIWADRSGSMNHFDHQVQLALMGLYNGSGQPNVRIPVGVGFFGGQSVSGDRIMRVAPISASRPPQSKALIAGFTGSTSNEFLHWALEDSRQALQVRSEERKILIVIHDGMPVYDGDWSMSLADLKQMDNDGVIVIGVYLGSEGDDCVPKLRMLFKNLILCQPNQLPEKLGNLLINIA